MRPLFSQEMSKAPSLHSNFFSSLKQVEKRLKLESPPPPQPTTHTTQSLASPIFLNFHCHNNHPQEPNQSTNLESSETPHEFLSNSDDFPSTLETPLPKPPQNPPETPNLSNHDDVTEIRLLIQLLGLSDCEDENPESRLKLCSSCRCEGGFYDKIVGMKGPKCEKEVERMKGWIRHFGEEGIEPLRMAHLLLGKAAFFKEDRISDGFEFEFPYTVEEFLHNDPPS